ncbi:MAG: DUF2029 domain-containing protein [Bacteroidales bacterium]|nr:DUF2029 domain-containing protein [Bacteroidales bacterium]
MKNNSDHNVKRWVCNIPETGWLVFIIFAGGALFASIQSLAFEYYFNPASGIVQSNYGNYTIFKQAWLHLINGKDLYLAYPHEQFDLFKYSPSFAVFFSLFAYLPDTIGLPLWCLLNAFILFFSIKSLPEFSNRRKNLILLFITLELITSLQNSQSNALMAGLLIFSFVFLERRNYLVAALLLVLSVYIKLFGIIALVLFIFYPGKWKLVLYTLFWGSVMFWLPLPFTGFDQLKFLYISWGKMLSADFSASLGFSVMGWLTSWFHLYIPKMIVVIAGALAGVIPLFYRKHYSMYTFRLFMLASLLIWVIIFNHKAESPTFIIAMSGVAIWLFARKMSTVNLILGILALLFTSLSTTELFMPFRDIVTEPYVLKAVPCIIIWGKIIFDMSTFSNETKPGR